MPATKPILVEVGATSATQILSAGHAPINQRRFHEQKLAVVLPDGRKDPIAESFLRMVVFESKDPNQRRFADMAPISRLPIVEV